MENNLQPQETQDFNRIIPINIEEQMKTAYIDYSMSVIVGRALPDVRDERSFHLLEYSTARGENLEFVGSRHAIASSPLWPTW